MATLTEKVQGLDFRSGTVWKNRSHEEKKAMVIFQTPGKIL